MMLVEWSTTEFKPSIAMAHHVFQLRNKTGEIIATQPFIYPPFLYHKGKPTISVLKKAASAISKQLGWKRKGGPGARVTYSIGRPQSARPQKRKSSTRRNPGRSPFAACHSTPSKRNPAAAITKRVEYSYASSPNAYRLGFGRKGCYTVEKVKGIGPGTAVKGFSTLEQARAYAETLKLPWNRLTR